MHTIEVRPRDWTARLDEFSRIHEGWVVSLDILDQSLGAQPEFAQLSLVGVTAEPGGGGTIVIAVTAPKGGHHAHLIHSPTRVFIEQTDLGADAALQIEAADGAKAILRFKTAAVPGAEPGLA